MVYNKCKLLHFFLIKHLPNVVKKIFFKNFLVFDLRIPISFRKFKSKNFNESRILIVDNTIEASQRFELSKCP